MSEVRAVPLDREQMSFVESLGLELMGHRRTEDATQLLAIALAWKVAPQVIAHDVFACDVDESADMAEVVELHNWSRKAPCA